MFNSLKITNFPKNIKNVVIECSTLKNSKTSRPVLCAHLSLVDPDIPPSPLNLISFNRELAKELGLNLFLFDHDEAARVLSGATPIQTEPQPASWAYCYGGHQFGSWAGQLGDGRAISIAQIETGPDMFQELQLKGAGKTPYSRNSDGLAVLRSSIREYLGAEAMHYLNVSTARSLSLVQTGMRAQREVEESAAVVCRVAPSWFRFGNFEIFYAREDVERLRMLADYTVSTPHFKERISLMDALKKYRSLLVCVVQDTALMIAKWQALGFCHGVMNTDNFSIQGLTIDYGPFQFLDAYDPAYICNHSDESGRYAFREQPGVGLFNLVRLATALSPLLKEECSDQESFTDNVKPILETYSTLFSAYYAKEMCRKLGFADDADTYPKVMETLVYGPLGLLQLLYDAEMDYTLFMRQLSVTAIACEQMEDAVFEKWVQCSYKPMEAFVGSDLEMRVRRWYVAFRDAHYTLRGGNRDDMTRRDAMKADNPSHVLRNHVVQRVIEAVEDGSDVGSVDRYLVILQTPFLDHDDLELDAVLSGSGGKVPFSMRGLKCSCSS